MFSPTLTKLSWSDWAWLKREQGLLWAWGMHAGLQDNLLGRYFTGSTLEGAFDLIACVRKSTAKLPAKAVAAYMRAFAGKSDRVDALVKVVK